MRYKNFQSDFEFFQELGNQYPAPFDLTYYIQGKEQKLVVSFDGERYVNCRPDGNGIIVSVDYSSVQLGIGKLRCTARYYLNNENYKDGVYEPVSDFEVGIELHRGESDDMGDLVATPLPTYHVVNAEGGGFSGDYNDLKNKPTIPTRVSELENDKGYMSEVPDTYATKDDVATAIANAITNTLNTEV